MNKRKDILVLNGRRFAATIHGTPARGKIEIKGDFVYLYCRDGREYCLFINNGEFDALPMSNIVDFAVYPETPEEVEEFHDWHTEDVLINKNYAEPFHEIVFRSGEFVVRKSTYEDGKEYVICSTCKELYDEGWRLKDSPKNMSVEVTIEDIRKAFNIPDEAHVIVTK